MFVEESLWVSGRLKELELGRGAVALDVGSSTGEYRRVRQPHIEHNVARPLRERGIEIRSLDVRDDPDVDYVCDLTAADFDPLSSIGRRFPLVLCNNVLVHLEDPERGAKAITSLVAPGGWLVASTPAAYRRVRDPLDNRLRPVPGELARLLIDNAEPGSRLTVVEQARVPVDSRRYYRRSLRPSWFLVGSRWVPVPGFVERVRYMVPRLRWHVSCVVLRRADEGA